MKKVIAIIALVVLMATPVYASVGDLFDKAVDYIKGLETKTGILVDIKDKDIEGFVGTALVGDLLGVEGLDVDGLVSSNDPLNTDEVTLSSGLSYNVSLNESIDAGLGVAYGLKRVEDLKELGESIYSVYGYVRF